MVSVVATGPNPNPLRLCIRLLLFFFFLNLLLGFLIPVNLLSFLSSSSLLFWLRCDHNTHTHSTNTTMKLFYIGIIRNNTKGEGLELASVKDVSSFSFFERSSVTQFMSFFADTVASRTNPGQRQSVQEGTTYTGHVYARTEGIAGVVITDQEYPVRVAYSLLNKVLDEYLVKYQVTPAFLSAATKANEPQYALESLNDYIKRYQDPQQADTMLKVQQELDETKIVLHKTIESVLDRGEKLDSLVEKSGALSQTSKLFYSQAKKTNSCCLIA